jgi:hypothetical protein
MEHLIKALSTDVSAKFFILALIVIIFYIPLAIMVFKVSQKRASRKLFFSGVFSVLTRVEDNTAALDQILIIYKKLAERFTYLGSSYKSATNFMEDLLCRLETFRESRFKEVYGIVFTNDYKSRVVDIIYKMKELQPFSSLSSKYGNLLNMIKHAIDTSNVDLGTSNLGQLADDIEVMESTIDSQAKKNRVSLVISAVGVILTLIFGAITLVQFFVASRLVQ